MHRRFLGRAPLAAALVSLVAIAPTTAQAVRAPAPGAGGADRFLDVRLALRDRAAPAGAVPGAGLAARSARAAGRVASARARLERDLGPQAVLDVDPLTGTVSRLQRLDGALTSPSGDTPAAVARGYADAHAAALGLDVADVRGLHVDEQLRSPSGLTVVRFGQAVDGIPTFDNGLRVGVDHAGRVLLVGGAPRSDLPASIGAPAFSAADALARLQDEVGTHRDITVTSTSSDARRTTTFSTGDKARLVLFGARGVHLAWHLTYAAENLEYYDAVVDATTGEVLYRANLVKFLAPVTVNVYHNYPGAPVGGTRTPEDITSYLNSAMKMSGPNVYAFADVNDGATPGSINTDSADDGEDVVPGDYVYNTAPPIAGNTAGSCTPTKQCIWDHTSPGSWENFGTNPDQWKANVVQTFWYANHFHDHLADHGPGFTAASGNFEGDDPLSLNALDGARSGGVGPDSLHVNNANMLTPADRQSPRMQMYLFANTVGRPYRDINGGDDAAVLYHEYTHGLSSRLVTNDDGTQALNSPQSGAMSEGWSDWYAQDLIVREHLVTDMPGTDGDVEMGRYTDSIRHTIRTQALDCAVGSSNTAACPAPAAPATAGPGGYTFGDFGKVRGRPQVHSDGEIWAQTLWEIRQKLVAKLGGDTEGSDAAERIFTDAMRLSIAEPSFLDMRNAILAADVNFSGGANRGLLWDVFARRGMGYFAGVVDGSDVAPVEDFAVPPAPDAPRGTVTGRVIDKATGLPLSGVKAGIGGLSTRSSFSPYLVATSDGDGRFTIGDVPQGTYPKTVFALPAYDRLVQPLTVGAGPAGANAELVRDWAAGPGGARIRATSDDTGAQYGCGAAALIDQSQGVGWSPYNPDSTNNPLPAPHVPPTATIELPGAITIDKFAADPSATCRDDSSATTKGYRIETSPDGVTWTTAVEGRFAASDAGRLNPLVPAAGAANVRFVRLTLLSPQGTGMNTSGRDFIDFSELEIYGNPPNKLPAGTLTASSSSVPPGGTVTFDASSFKDPDSAITGYDWDFDGNGTVDATTAIPTATQSYAAEGSFNATVAVKDYRGGAGTGSTPITVAVPKAPPFNPPPKARPSLVLPRTAAKGRVRFKATCNDPCRVGAELRVTAATKRRLRLRSVIVGRLAAKPIKGTKRLTVSLTKDARRRILRRGIREVRVALRVAATVPGPGGSAVNGARSVSLKL